VDRFNLAIDVIERVPNLVDKSAHTVEWLRGQIIDSINYAHENGIDRKEIREWKWPA
jgi:xylulose-5-phosphate/fructose-6-phosphate phosphoketolase